MVKSKRPKKKHRKANEPSLNNRRKLSRHGKEVKKGQLGPSTYYISRNVAIKKLQVSLKDFRRLCILKGIYPTQPPNPTSKLKTKLNVYSQTFYHVNDVKYLRHEPLLVKFRQMKTFMKKVRKRLAARNYHDAKKMYGGRPNYTLAHLVRERYPAFVDGLQDLDDALCLAHLFANLPATSNKEGGREADDEDDDDDDAGDGKKSRGRRGAESARNPRKRVRIGAELTESCSRLCKEWQLFVVRSHALRKVFVSVKGIYYQAEVDGEEITWVVPHKFAQNFPGEVDFKVMITFIQFYECFLGFMFYKLYHQLGLKYPPTLDVEKDEKGAFLGSLKVEHLESVAREETDVQTVQVIDTAETGDAGLKSGLKPGLKASTKQKGKKKIDAKTSLILKNITKKAQIIARSEVQEDATELNRSGELASDGEEVEEEEEEVEDGDAEGEGEGGVFDADEMKQKIMEQEKKTRVFRSLLKGFVFLISLEVPFEPLEFCINAFGGKVLNSTLEMNATLSLEALRSVTHVVTDREYKKSRNQVIKKLVQLQSCEFIQPQWVFDSINARIVLPIAKYTADCEELPPHLSPFVDDNEEGYIPSYRDELENLKAASARLNDEEYASLGLLNNVEDDKAGKQPGEQSGSSDDEGDSEGATDSEADVEAERVEDSESVDEASEEEGQEEEKTSGPESSEPQFLPSKAFKGRKEGFVFKMGSQGLGYYFDKHHDKPIEFKTQRRISNRQRRKQEKNSMKDMGKIVMKKGAKRLYNRMQHGIKKKQNKVDALKRKRELLEKKSKKTKVKK